MEFELNPLNAPSTPSTPDVPEPQHLREETSSTETTPEPSVQFTFESGTGTQVHYKA